MTWTIDPAWAVERFLDSYLLLEGSIPGFQSHDEGALLFLHFARPKGGLLHEVIVRDDSAPAESVAAVRRHGPLPDTFVTIFSPDPDASLPIWDAAGYAPLLHEYVMAYTLAAAETDMRDPDVRPVATAEDAQRVNAAREREVIHPAYLRNPAIRFWTLEAGGEPACSAALLRIEDATCVIESVATLPHHQRRGHAARLIHALHAEAARQGATRIVLLSSQEGRPLYDKLGYTFLRDVFVLIPNRLALSS